MAFRGEEEALRAKVRALQEEVETLKAGEDPPTREKAPRAARVTVGAVLLVAAGVLGAAALLPLGRFRVIIALLAVLVLAVSLLATIITSFLEVVRPNELLVLSGRQTVSADGQVRPYRSLRGGRTVRIPFLERSDRLDLSPFPVARQVRRAVARDSAPVDVAYRATFRLAGEGPAMHHAIERWVGREPAAIAEVAADLLESRIRESAAQSTASQLPHLGAGGLAALEEDLVRLGLVMDEFVVVDVRDAGSTGAA